MKRTTQIPGKLYAPYNEQEMVEDIITVLIVMFFGFIMLMLAIPGIIETWFPKGAL